MKIRLLNLLKTHSLKKGYFILTSGKHSTTLIDCKPVLLTAQGHWLAASLIFNEIQRLHAHTRIDAVAAVPLGGCSLASGVSTYSAKESSPLDALYVRKEVKNHGSNNLIEGSVPKESQIVLLEDVITSGGSSINALNTLKNNNYIPVAVICVVDRLEGGREAIENKFNIPVISLFTIKDFQ